MNAGIREPTESCCQGQLMWLTFQLETPAKLGWISTIQGENMSD